MTGEDRLLVAAYCRVSTDRADQANSLRSQQEYFHTYIKEHAGWRLANIYADEGLSGTSTNRRAAFGQMMEDAAAGKFSLILTKEVSRFARNTVDTLAYTRRLKELGVGVVFLSDSIDTRDNDGELRLTIMASMAQEESRKTSQRVKWGQRRRMEAGVVFGSDSTYGFQTRGGALTVRPAEAEVVRLIYRKYLEEGKGSHVIARELNEAGIVPPRAERWSENTILRILRNEKYVGDLRQKKYVTVDYLTHRKVENRGLEDQICLRDHHQAIVERGVWEGVQRELARRRPAEAGGARHSARYWSSGRVRCGRCGAPFVPRTSRRKDGTIYKSWGCKNSCGVGMVNDKALLACGRLLLERLGVVPEQLLAELLEQVGRLRKRDQGSQGAKAARQSAAQRRLKRAVEGYLDGILTREEVEQARARYQEEMNRTEPERAYCEMPKAEVTQILWEELLRTCIEGIEVHRDSLLWHIRCEKQDIRIWYAVHGRGEKYRTEILGWKAENREENPMGKENKKI